MVSDVIVIVIVVSDVIVIGIVVSDVIVIGMVKFNNGTRQYQHLLCHN